MSASYWKTLGESIARRLGENAIKRLSTGGKFLGRAGTVAGIGFLVYEFFKNYKDNIENEPAYKEMMILQAEMDKWTNAISCIGREPFVDKAFGTFYEGGAINALYRKKLFDGPGAKAPDPEEACALIEKAIEYILETENLFEDDDFEEKRKSLADQLRRAHVGARGRGPVQFDAPQPRADRDHCRQPRLAEDQNHARGEDGLGYVRAAVFFADESPRGHECPAHGRPAINGQCG